MYYYWVSVSLLFSLSLSLNERSDATYTATHLHSSAARKAPFVLDLIEIFLEHLLGINGSSNSTLFKNSFCSNTKGCIDYKQISGLNAPQPIFVAELNTSEVNNPLPTEYKEFIPSLSPLVAPRPTQIQDDQVPPSPPQGMFKHSPRSHFKVPQELPNHSSIPTPSLEPLTTLPSSSQPHLEVIEKKQADHISAFYLKQMSARYLNWCYTNDYANLIHPFLPDGIAGFPRNIKKSICSHRMHRTILLILRHAKTQLSSKYAKPLLFSFPLFVYIQELAFNIDTALTSLGTLALSKQIDATKRDVTMDSRRNQDFSKVELLHKVEDHTVKEEEVKESNKTESELEEELIDKDNVTDTILVGCKALLKVPYYMSQDPNRVLFYPDAINKSPALSAVVSSPSDERNSSIDPTLLAIATAKCDKVIPIILEEYEKNEDRQLYQEYYANKDHDKLNGRRIIFPEFPLNVDEMRELVRLDETSLMYCEGDDEDDVRQLLHCLNAVSSNLSLMLGMITSNLYHIIPAHSRKVVPVLERLQALQLVAIYFDEKENALSEVGMELTASDVNSTVVGESVRDKIVVEEEEPEANIIDSSVLKGKDLEQKLGTLRKVIDDVMATIYNYVIDMQSSYIEKMRQVLRIDKLKSLDDAIRWKGKPKRRAILGHSLEYIISYMKNKLSMKRNRPSVKNGKKGEKKNVAKQKGIDVMHIEDSNDDYEDSPETNKLDIEELIIKKEEEFEDNNMIKNSMVEEKIESPAVVDGVKDEESSVKPQSRSPEKRPKKKSIKEEMDNPNNLDIILENLLLQFFHIILPHPALHPEDLYKNTEIRNNRKFAPAYILNVYRSIEAMYHWSIPNVFFLNKKYVGYALTLELTNYGLSRGDFTFPGERQSLKWLQWSQKQAVNLGKFVVDVSPENPFAKNGKSTIRESPVEKKGLRTGRKKCSNSAQIREGNVGSPTRDISQKKHSEDFNIFAVSILKAALILPNKKPYKAVSLVKLFSRSLSKFVGLMEYYEKILLCYDNQAASDLTEALNEDKRGSMALTNMFSRLVLQLKSNYPLSLKLLTFPNALDTKHVISPTSMNIPLPRGHPTSLSPTNTFLANHSSKNSPSKSLSDNINSLEKPLDITSSTESVATPIASRKISHIAQQGIEINREVQNKEALTNFAVMNSVSTNSNYINQNNNFFLQHETAPMIPVLLGVPSALNNLKMEYLSSVSPRPFPLQIAPLTTNIDYSSPSSVANNLIWKDESDFKQLTWLPINNAFQPPPFSSFQYTNKPETAIPLLYNSHNPTGTPFITGLLDRDPQLPHNNKMNRFTPPEPQNNKSYKNTLEEEVPMAEQLRRDKRASVVNFLENTFADLKPKRIFTEKDTYKSEENSSANLRESSAFPPVMNPHLFHPN